MYMITCDKVSILCESEDSLKKWIQYLIDKGLVPLIKKVS